jgi:hypothetical protein
MRRAGARSGSAFSWCMRSCHAEREADAVGALRSGAWGLVLPLHTAPGRTVVAPLFLATRVAATDARRRAPVGPAGEAAMPGLLVHGVLFAPFRAGRLCGRCCGLSRSVRRGVSPCMLFSFSRLPRRDRAPPFWCMGFCLRLRRRVRRRSSALLVHGVLVRRLRVVPVGCVGRRGGVPGVATEFSVRRWVGGAPAAACGLRQRKRETQMHADGRRCTRMGRGTPHRRGSPGCARGGIPDGTCRPPAHLRAFADIRVHLR